MKTIAIIGSCDTKYREIAYMREQVESQGVKAMVINVATGLNPSYGYDVSREDVTKAAGKEWAELEPKTKGEKIAFMMEAVASYVEKLYKEGKIDGILSAGGLQNTVMATNAMKRLPIGFPKVMATTVASGRKTFESVVGTKDIVTVPSICDFTGLNIVTRQIMENACACCVGMVKYAGQILKKGDRPVVGVTLMGITNTGACAAIDELERLGIETIGFHSTGAGGAIMEQMAADGMEEVIVQPTHIINGIENDKMMEDLMEYTDRFKKIRAGRPLLTSVDDYKKAIHAVMAEVELKEGEALVLMGHGTDHHANAAYPTLEYTFHSLGYSQVLVGTVEGFPDLRNVMTRLEISGMKKVMLMPFMVVAGDHAKNDMAGEDDSWKTELEAAGYEVRTLVKGLGEMKGIRNIYAEHIEAVM